MLNVAKQELLFETQFKQEESEIKQLGKDWCTDMIGYEILNELEKISGKVQSDIQFTQQDEIYLQRALHLKSNQYIGVIERLLSCVKILVADRNDINFEVQRQTGINENLLAQIAELEEENQRLKKEMESYNGTLLQRARVKAGTVKPAEKAKPTKTEVQSLINQGFNREQIAAKYGVSRSTIWRMLKD